MAGYTSKDMKRFREVADPFFHEGLPDEAVAGLMIFAWWVFGERVRDVGREIVKEIRRLIR